ncbi:bzip transcription factor 44 [Anaeramoeba flamelloides]|uniref:Bzip transcription factor 44 n=1 Tax=Anaeramoeba flamelloides TaxID=1746091 RepID=A0ABQ8X7J0_9EUKA|nr:bzip transcription factor 44 [Anaeramoeba flamelloides]
MNKNLTFDEQPIDFFFPDLQQTHNCFPLQSPINSQALTTKNSYSVSDEYEKAIEENLVLNRKPLLSWHLQPNTANDYEEDLFSLFSDNPTPSGESVLLNSIDPYSDDENAIFEKQNTTTKSKPNRVINKQDLENFKTKEILTKCSKHHEKVKSELLNRHELQTQNAILTNQKFLTYNEKKIKKKSKKLIIPLKEITTGQLPQQNACNNNNKSHYTGFVIHKKITKIPIKNKNMIQPLLEEAQAFLDNYKQNDQDLMTEEEKILLKKMSKKELSKLSSLEKKNRKRARDRLSARRVRIKQQAYVKYLKNHISNLKNENSTLENRLSTRLQEQKKLELRIQNLKTRKRFNKISKRKNRKLFLGNNNNAKKK